MGARVSGEPGATPSPVFPRGDERTSADDGDAFRFCSTCAFSQACLAQGMNKRELAQLHLLVEHVGTFQAGDYIFRRGDAFDAIAAVRGGSVKTSLVDLDGHERVLGFHFPGEVIGLDGIDGDRYPCDAVALDTVAVCRFSFPRMADLATRLPLLQQHLFRLLSRDIHAATRLGGDWSADTRIAAFLVDIGRRLASRGFSARRFELTMARTDIANYLRLAPETVSRVLRRFQESGLVGVDRREIELLDVKRLESLAAPALAT
jgi:CRP/FNR family transcriptional regulator